MTWSLFDNQGARKYLTPAERAAVMREALKRRNAAGTFCLTLALTGARISEVLRLAPRTVDVSAGAIVIETLKRRKRGVFRALPVPDLLIRELEHVHNLSKSDVCARIWPWSRTTAWKYVKEIMMAAGVAATLAKPRAMRHAFGVDAVQNRIALNIIQKWLGHAKLETTAIYAEPIGREERELARLLWKKFMRQAAQTIRQTKSR